MLTKKIWTKNSNSKVKVKNKDIVSLEDFYYLALSKFWVGKKNCDDHTASNRHTYMATYTLLPAQPLGCLDSLLDYHAY